jgi:hypothetical protein
MSTLKRRWKWWAGLGLVLLATIGLLALPAVHWPLLGWLRGEAFYRGRPTSYWQREVARLEPYCGGFRLSYDTLPTPGTFSFGVPAAAGGATPFGADWWDACKEALGLNRQVPPDEMPGWLVLYGRTPSAALAVSANPDGTAEISGPFVDAATLPVQRQLLQCDNAFVRCLVLRFFKYQATEDVFPLMQAALHDADLDVRLEAAFTLKLFVALEPDPNAPAFLETVKLEQLVPIFAQGLEHENAWVQSQCANALGGCGAAAKSALPALRSASIRAEKEEDSVAKESIAAALQAIDPEAVPKTSGK